MYESYWEMSRRPFDQGYEGHFFYPSEMHHATLLKLRYAVENRGDLAVLVGESGIGKTLLVHHLLRSLPATNEPRCHLVFPQLSAADLMIYLADQLEGQVSTETVDLRTTINRLEALLRSAVQADRYPVVVLDEAHLLADPLILEQFRLLLNFRHAEHSMFTLILVGNTSLVPILEESTELQSRIDTYCPLQPLSVEETIAYIQFRLAAAGIQRQIFKDAALEAIHYGTSGNPRSVNRICDLALLMGYAQDCQEIGIDVVQAVLVEATIPVVV